VDGAAKQEGGLAYRVDECGLPRTCGTRSRRALLRPLVRILSSSFYRRMCYGPILGPVSRCHPGGWWWSGLSAAGDVAVAGPHSSGPSRNGPVWSWSTRRWVGGLTVCITVVAVVCPSRASILPISLRGPRSPSDLFPFTPNPCSPSFTLAVLCSRLPPCLCSVNRRRAPTRPLGCPRTYTCCCTRLAGRLRLNLLTFRS
jgi:hypothetical protein